MTPEADGTTRRRYRLRFAKEGDLRYLSHRDLLRTFERLFRRAELVLAMTAGFHPKPRWSFLSALAVGVVGLEEVLELELDEPLAADELLRRLAAQSPPGLRFHAAVELAPGAKKARARSLTYAVAVPEERRAALAARIEQLLAATSFPVVRPDQKKSVDVRPLLIQAALTAGELRFQVLAPQEGGVRPREILTALGLDDLEAGGVLIVRVAVEIDA